jgi:hypothetical protein
VQVYLRIMAAALVLLLLLGLMGGMQ